MGEREIAREIERRLAEDGVLDRLIGRQPNYLYWQTPDGAMFLYTTERGGDGKFWSAVLVPKGKGSRSGKRNVTEWHTRREVHHSTRKAARARALRLYMAHKEGRGRPGSEPTVPSPQDNPRDGA